MSLATAPVWNGLEDLRPVLALRLRARCRDENELDDLIQETFLRAARYRRSLGDSNKLAGWLVRIARNVQHDAHGRNLRLAHGDVVDELLDQVPGREGAPGECPDECYVRVGSQLVERARLLRHLSAALDELAPDDLLVLERHYRDRQGTTELAARLGVTTEMVKVRLYRARQRLRRRVRATLTTEIGRFAAFEEVRA